MKRMVLNNKRKRTGKAMCYNHRLKVNDIKKKNLFPASVRRGTKPEMIAERKDRIYFYKRWKRKDLLDIGMNAYELCLVGEMDAVDLFHRLKDYIMKNKGKMGVETNMTKDIYVIRKE